MFFLKRINYLGKFISLFILAGISLSLTILIVLFYELNDYQLKSDLEKIEYEVNNKKKETKKLFKKMEKFLLTINDNHFFKEYLKNPTIINQNYLNQIIIPLLENEETIMQFRYINNNGLEMIRFDRKEIGSNLIQINKSKLQNKRHRDYFKKTINLNRNEIFVSNLDLNIENKKIEIPYRPVIRFAIKIKQYSENKGILIINIFADSILKKLIKSENFFIDIYDQDKNILVSNNIEKKQWTKYLKSKSNLTFENSIYNEKLIKINNYETLYISGSQKNWISNFLKFINYKIILILMLVIIISFILAYYLAKIPKKLFDELENQQNIIEQQSKLAAMGEMTSMLAHQWRQPLNAITVLLQELKIKNKMNILDDREFEEIYTKIKNITNHMSQTINNFRDFFKPSKKKSQFNIYDAIQEAYTILENKIESSDIIFKVIPENKDGLIINSFKGEFIEVIVNLVNNSVEAFHNKDYKNKFISISLSSLNDNILIEFEDNAGGINLNNIDKIFEPYYSNKTELNGTGIGLYMAKMIIEKNMNGKLKVKNHQNGVLFSIILPITNDK